ncbi:MAG: hypothetical protein AB1847_10325 [bacterium]
MKRILVIGAVVVLLASCTIQGDRTDAEMFEAANEIYQDYLFEYGIDSALFSSPTIETRQNGIRSYKWIAIGSKGTTVGVEIIVKKMKGTKPEMILIGDTDAWLPFVGSKNKK